jgi:hypothetical protein
MTPGRTSLDKVDPAVEAELDRLPQTRIADLRTRYRELFRAEPPKAFGPDQLVKAAKAKPNGRLELPQRIKPGSELVRTWNRRTYRVVVLETGFAHQGRTYQSLSEIASEITGTKWNGPRFFGLRRSKETAGDQTDAG